MFTFRQRQYEDARDRCLPAAIVQEAYKALRALQNQAAQEAENPVPLLQKRQALASSHVSQRQKSDAILAKVNDNITKIQPDKAGLATARGATKEEALSQHNAAIEAADSTLVTATESYNQQVLELKDDFKREQDRYAAWEAAFAAGHAGVNARITSTGGDSGTSTPKIVIPKAPPHPGHVAHKVFLTNMGQDGGVLAQLDDAGIDQETAQKDIAI